MKIAERLAFDEARDLPSYFRVVAPYLRSYRHGNRHCRTSDLMPWDRTLTKALRKAYRTGTAEERAVMTGSSTLSGREQSRVFNQLCFKVAKLAGMTATIIITSEEEKTEELHEFIFE